MCRNLDGPEQFMVDWLSTVEEDDDGSQVYRFVLENKEFSVHELYWSVMSFGGLSRITKWKDIANDMLNRKYNFTVSAAPGKNYGVIRNQWERWNLSKYAEMFGTKMMPAEYSKSSVPKSKARDYHKPAAPGTCCQDDACGVLKELRAKEQGKRLSQASSSRYMFSR